MQPPAPEGKKSGRTAKGDAKKGDAGEQGSPKGDDVKTVMANAVKVKNKYVKALMSADYIKQSIREEASWKWVSAACTTLGFDAAYKALNEQEGEFSKAFHMHELSDMKKRFSTEAIIAGCQAYSKNFLVKISPVEAETKKLTKMHLVQSAL